jgi:hypothetical protein
MKLVNPLRLCAPLFILAAAFVLAPPSRAQEVAPDHFEIAPNPPAGAGAAPAIVAKPSPTKAAVHAGNKKPGAQMPVANSANNLSRSQKPEVVAVQDKHKLPASKPNN